MKPIEPALARALVLDELFDLALYQALRDVAPPGALRSVLDRMIPIERRHVKFWQDFLGLPLTALGARRRIELALLVAVCRLFGAPAIHLVLEAIEVYGVRKYLAIWETCQGSPLEPGLRGILRDEFEHIRRRMLTNLVILAAAAALSYGIGVAAQRSFGIAS